MDWINEIKAKYGEWAKRNAPYIIWQITGYTIDRNQIILIIDNHLKFGYNINEPVWVLL